MRRPKYSAEQAQVCLSPVAMQPYRLAGLPIPLELDHINGNNGDNRLENLRLLCPNCHALTPTYRSKRRTKA
jgi:5-methylcytosine-specific restriction endonuclease McrA